MTFIYTLNAPKLGSLNGFEISLDGGIKFLKELSRKFLVMICMIQNRRPYVRICSQQLFLEVALFSFFQRNFCKTLTVSSLLSLSQAYWQT